MTQPTDNLPGAQPSKGTIRIGQVLSSGRGANAALSLHPQGHRLVSAWCGAESALEYWAVDQLKQLGRYVVDAQLSDVGAALAPALVPAGAEKNRDAWPTHVLPIVDAAVSTSGQVVAAAAGKALHIYRQSADEMTLEPVGSMRAHAEPVARVAVDAGGDRAMSTDGFGNVTVWSVGEQRTLHRLRISKVPTVARFIWNDMLAMVGDDTGRVICWELERGQRHLQFQAHHGALTSAAFNSDSGTLLTAGVDRAARMWNLELGKQIGRDMAHPGTIHDAVFAYAGRFIVTCGGDGHVAVWNSTDGDLIDWYFDSGPVYRVAFDALNGTVIIAGARTVKVLRVDWQRLRELDADARANVMDISPADHAALFSAPPSRPPVTYDAGGGADAAPVGSILAARQTADLPFPDRSNLAIERGPAPAPPAPSASPWGGGAAPNTQAVPAIGAATQAPPSREQPQAPQNGLGSSGLAGGAFGSLAAAVESTNLTSGTSASSPTSYGVGGASSQAQPVDDADAFFRSLGDGARHSRMETDGFGDVAAKAAAGAPIDAPAPPEPAAPPSQPRPAAPPEDDSGMSRFGGRPTGMEAPQRPSRVSAAARPTAEVAPASDPEAQAGEIRRRLTIGVIIIVVVTLGAWVGTRTYFTTSAYPETVRLQAETAVADFEQAQSAADAAFESFRESQQQQLRDYERRSLPAAELERITARIESRIADREEEAREQVWLAQQRHDATIAELEAERRTAASSMAGRAAGIAGLIFLLLVALWVGRAARPRAA